MQIRLTAHSSAAHECGLVTKAAAILRVCLIFIAAAGLLLKCESYGLKEKLENPDGGNKGNDSCSDTGVGVVKSGLVGFWAFNGSLEDNWDCGSGLQAGSGTTFSFVADRFGIGGNAVDLIANTGKVQFGNLPVFSNPPLTFCSWLRPTSAGLAFPISRFLTGNGYQIRVNNGPISLEIGIQGTFPVVVGTGMTAGTWNYVCVTYDGATASGYTGQYGGSLISSSAAAAGYVAPAVSLDLNAATSFAVQFDDVLFYNRVLSAAEVQRNFQSSGP